MNNPIQFLINQMMNNNQAMQNPTIRNAINMSQNGDFNGVERLARNLCKEKNIDPDKAFQQFLGRYKR